MYNNHDSRVKHKTRLEVLHKAEKVIKKQGRVEALTLPSSNFIFEDMLIKRNPGKYKLDCVERDEKVYQEVLLKTQDNKNVRLFNSDVFAYLKNSNEKYNFLWLDLCGPMSQGNVLNILSLVQQDVLDDSCYLAITLLANREVKAKEMEKLYGTSMEKIRTSVFPNLVEYYAKQVGKKTKIDPIIHYKCELKTNSSPMNVYGFSFK